MLNPFLDQRSLSWGGGAAAFATSPLAFVLLLLLVPSALSLRWCPCKEERKKGRFSLLQLAGGPCAPIFLSCNPSKDHFFPKNLQKKYSQKKLFPEEPLGLSTGSGF